MITFFRQNELRGLSLVWWECLGRSCTSMLRYRTPREVGVRFLSLEEMRVYNARYRKKDRPTDVLSFEPTPDMKQESPEYLGDLLLCPAYAAHEADRRGIARDEELARLVIHGVLHLVGYDHATLVDEARMFAKQEACLSRFLVCLNRS